MPYFTSLTPSHTAFPCVLSFPFSWFLFSYQFIPNISTLIVLVLTETWESEIKIKNLINPKKSGRMIGWPYIPCFPDRNALEISTVSPYLFLYLSLWLPCFSDIPMANSFKQLLSLSSDSRFNFIGSPRVSVQTNILQHIPSLVS